MSTTLPDFGQAARDYVPAAFDDDDVWILKFKVGSTQIRICPAEMTSADGTVVYGTEAWPTEREHYDNALPGGAYPCAERFGIECVGCKHPDKKVRAERSRYYYINVLDDQGQNRVYKLGTKLFQIFQQREQRALGRDPKNKQPLSDRDYYINRTGSGKNDTTYDPEPGDAYEVPGGWPEQLHDIKAILRQKYSAAVEFYAGGEPAAQRDDDDDVQDTPPPRSGRISTAKDEEKDTGDDAPIWFENPTKEDLEDATVKELKQFLDSKEIEYPERAPRGRLLSAATKALEPPF